MPFRLLPHAPAGRFTSNLIPAIIHERGACLVGWIRSTPRATASKAIAVAKRLPSPNKSPSHAFSIGVPATLPIAPGKCMMSSTSRDIGRQDIRGFVQGIRLPLLGSAAGKGDLCRSLRCKSAARYAYGALLTPQTVAPEHPSTDSPTSVGVSLSEDRHDGVGPDYVTAGTGRQSCH